VTTNRFIKFHAKHADETQKRKDQIINWFTFASFGNILASFALNFIF